MDADGRVRGEQPLHGASPLGLGQRRVDDAWPDLQLVAAAVVEPHRQGDLGSPGTVQLLANRVGRRIVQADVVRCGVDPFERPARLGRRRFHAAGRQHTHRPVLGHLLQARVGQDSGILRVGHVLAIGQHVVEHPGRPDRLPWPRRPPRRIGGGRRATDRLRPRTRPMARAGPESRGGTASDARGAFWGGTPRRRRAATPSNRRIGRSAQPDEEARSDPGRSLPASPRTRPIAAPAMLPYCAEDIERRRGDGHEARHGETVSGPHAELDDGQARSGASRPRSGRWRKATSAGIPSWHRARSSPLRPAGACQLPVAPVRRRSEPRYRPPPRPRRGRTDRAWDRVRERP